VRTGVIKEGCGAGEVEESLLERVGVRFGEQGWDRIECDELAVIKDGDAMSEQFNLREGVGSEKD
jgi:hypothetical protein